ncbi:MAG: mechanosensitive ion channel domain-containing protein [Pseudomonadota bacterium]
MTSARLKPVFGPSALLIVIVFVATLLGWGDRHALAQSTSDAQEVVVTTVSGGLLRPIRTESPRATLESFLSKSEEFAAAILEYRSNKSLELARRIDVLSEQILALIDLSEVPLANRRKIGDQTTMALLDILWRVEPPSVTDAPNVEQLSELGESGTWRFPLTPLQIGLMSDGPREGEYLFTAETVNSAPRFFGGISDRPFTRPLPFSSWTEMSRRITGPLLPAWLDTSVPSALQVFWLETPVWKVLLTVLFYALTAGLGFQVYRLIGRTEPEDRMGRAMVYFIAPVVALAALYLLVPIVVLNINLSGRASDAEVLIRTILSFLAWSWLFWLSVRLAFEWTIKSPETAEGSYDANLMRLVSGIIGVVGVVLILAFGGQQLGLPVLSLLAGLGVGGLAVALAIRPTLENLISGFTLYADKPIRVGDFCTFGGQNGTVEKIGIRSTQIRALDRTLISVPNAQFADMQLVNWARCDQMLIEETIGVRYETTPDQLRFLLAGIREMCHRHPRIDPQTVRVRFIGYGDSALNIGLRIYAKTREWNDFYAIREDIFLRIYDLVTDAGSGFAFPSQTVYFGRDTGLDEDAGKAAERKVHTWRRSGKLPFPRLPEEHQEKLEGTLDYPPRGSYESGGEDLEAAAGTERLSAEPMEEELVEEGSKPQA